MPIKLPPDKLALAISMQASGHTREIGAALGVNEKTVRRHMTAYNLAVAEQLEAEGREERVRQIDQFYWMLSQSLRAWVRSLEPSETVKVVEGGKDDGKIERTVKGQSGNPGHINAAVSVLTSLQKLYRLDADPDDPAASEAAARGQIAGAILGALADLPEDVRTLVGERLAGALMVGSQKSGRGR